ncbi:MAG: glycoside hydrolase family 99-like domain-containing protein [Gammaproteobacteria bacterium]|nr:glycoside hydrolase family 99-like domain-containing protein [Pseudomonadales bacterium]
MTHTDLSVIALYLPQYHPIPENDEWWGKGFTEWTNVTKAKPLYRGHKQPNLPADLGFYDLRVSETREEQAALAQNYGVTGFCYYHYWFGGGRRLLERPFDEVLSSGKPDFPFMLCWANQTWTGAWHGLDKKVLIEQTYPGRDDEIQHFEYLSRAFNDPRYIRVDGKPVFMIFQPSDLPEPVEFTSRLRSMAVEAGFEGLYLIAEHGNPFWDATAHGFDAFVNKPGFRRRRGWTPWKHPVKKLRNKWLDFRGKPTISSYQSKIEYFVPEKASQLAIPCVLPNWDNTPRSGSQGLVLKGSTPELFGKMLGRAIDRCQSRDAKDNFLFVKSWNEWAEGNHLEPGTEYGHSYLEQLKARISDS